MRKPLAGTDNATYPFWSPDSRSIGFFQVPDKLKTIEISGGPARDIADVVWAGEAPGAPKESSCSALGRWVSCTRLPRRVAHPSR